MDDFEREILRCYFVAAVREMVAVTVRAAYSTCFSEGVDFTCALFDSQGRMFAQEGGIAVHLGGLFDVVQELRSTYPEMRPGDVYLHNDPLNGGSHQADVSVAIPMYASDRFLGIAVNRGHWIDVGGMAAGGWCGAARHVIQEAVRIPATRLYSSGVVSEELKRLLLANIRTPRESWGDLEAQIASCRVAEARMVEALERYGADGFVDGIDYVLAYSRRRLAASIAELPTGEYLGSEELEDDGAGNGPFHVTARVTVGDGRIVVDLSDASPQAAGPINGSWACTKAGVYAALKAILDPDMPLDAALTEVVSIEGRKGTWIRPNYPAPSFAAPGEPSYRVAEAVLRALAEAVPEKVMASSNASAMNMTGWGFNPEDDSEFVWYQYGPGGCGGRAHADGNSALWHLMVSCKNESLEVWERRFPVRFVSFQLCPDSGGVGKFRGGLGCRKEFVVLSDTTVNVIQDRHFRGARGLFGGGRGAPNAVLFRIDGEWGDGTTHFKSSSPSKLGNVYVPGGSSIAWISGGGGGYGDPTKRSTDASEHDRKYGYVTLKKQVREMISPSAQQGQS